MPIATLGGYRRERGGSVASAQAGRGHENALLLSTDQELCATDHRQEGTRAQFRSTAEWPATRRLVSFHGTLAQTSLRFAPSRALPPDSGSALVEAREREKPLRESPRCRPLSLFIFRRRRLRAETAWHNAPTPNIASASQSRSLQRCSRGVRRLCSGCCRPTTAVVSPVPATNRSLTENGIHLGKGRFNENCSRSFMGVRGRCVEGLPNVRSPRRGR